MSDIPPVFSILIPLEFHRGQAEACIRAWTQGQTYPRDRFEVILAAPPGLSAADGDALRALLSPRDRLVTGVDHHDMPLVAAAAAVAQGDVFFFTESHCWPEPGVLAVCADAFRQHPDWSGFSCRSVRVTHNPLSVVEADLYEADILHGMTRHPWRKILDQCFVVRREPYVAAGGFDATLGHFAEWMLAAAFHRRGFALGYVPDARIHHYYIGDLAEWREFTEDFLRGEALALRRGDAAAFADLLDPVAEWLDRNNRSRLAALHLLRVTLRDAPLAPRWRDLARWTQVLVGGTDWPRLIAALRARRTGARLRAGSRHESGDRLTRLAVADVQAFVAHRRLEELAESGAGRPLAVGESRGDVVADEDAGVWEPGAVAQLPIAGAYLPEQWQHNPLRWSEPVASAELPLAPGTYDLVVQWLPVRPADRPARPRFYLNGAPLTAATTNQRAHAHVAVAEAGARLAWTSDAFASAGDSRRLGVPLRRIAWRRVESTAAARRPLAFLHIRKVGGTSLVQRLVNRFHPDACVHLAHSPRCAATDFDAADFVTGHLRYADLPRFARPPIAVTMLRSPVERALSAFHFFRQNDEAFLNEIGQDLTPEEFTRRRDFTAAARNRSLLDFLRHEPDLARWQLANVMTRAMLSEAFAGPLEARHLDDATNNLAACAVVGLTEQMDGTLALIEDAMGWEGLGPGVHVSRTRGRGPSIDEDPRALELLAEWNQLDHALYEHARERFATRLQAVDARRRAAPRVSAAPSRCALPAASTFTMDQPIHGSGWHTRERHDGRWMCWTGPAREAWVDLAIDDMVPSVLSLTVAHASSDAALASLRVMVNGQVLLTRQRQDGPVTVVEGDVPVSLLFAFSDRVRVALTVDAVQAPHDTDPTNPETRTLGVAVERIQLTPKTFD